MKKAFSQKWKASTQPRKQRKYRHNAPMHVLGKFLSAHLSDDLVKKYGARALRLRTGDKVRIMRGSFKGTEGKVDLINLEKSKVIITGVEIAKKDGSKSRPMIHASNLLILELGLDDKTRLPVKDANAATQGKKEVKAQTQAKAAKKEKKQ